MRARLHRAMRVRHDAVRTERAYLGWIRRYLAFHVRRELAALGRREAEAFLSHLAVERRVSASTQGQALAALLFFHREVSGVELPWLDDLVRARKPARLPVVLSRREVRSVLDHIDGVPRLVASLLYGSGLRLLEACRLRIQDVDFDRHEILIRAAKGGRDRRALLPASLVTELRVQRGIARAQHAEDVATGAGWVGGPSLRPPEGRLRNGSGLVSSRRPEVADVIRDYGEASRITCPSRSWWALRELRATARHLPWSCRG